MADPTLAINLLPASAPEDMSHQKFFLSSKKDS